MGKKSNQSKTVATLASTNPQRHPITINLFRTRNAKLQFTLNIVWEISLRSPRLSLTINLIALLTSTQKSDNEIYVYSDVPITFRLSSIFTSSLERQAVYFSPTKRNRH